MSDKLTIACPSCNKELNVPRTLAGKAATCPGCNKPFRVGVPTEPEEILTPMLVEPEPLTPMLVEPAPLDSTLQPQLSPQDGFQNKPPQQSSGAPRKTTRREKLQKGRERQSAEADSEMAWKTAGTGVTLIIVGFVAIAAAAGMEGDGRKARVVVDFFQLFGPFASFLGVLIGLGGVGCIAMSIPAQVPKIATIGICGVLSLFIALSGGGVFLAKMGAFGSGPGLSGGPNLARANPGFPNGGRPVEQITQAELERRRAEAAEAAKADMERRRAKAAEARRKTKANNDKFIAQRRDRATQALNGSNNIPGFKDNPVFNDNPFEKKSPDDPNPFGNGGNKKPENPFGSGADKAKPDNPFANGGSNKTADNPFGASEKNENSNNPFGAGQPKDSPFGATEPKANPFGGGKTKSNPFANDSSKDNPFAGNNNGFDSVDKNNPFGSKPDKSSMSDNEPNNPFGGGLPKETADNPFANKAPKSDNPFAGGSKGNGSDPFGGGSKKLAEDPDNPFGGGNAKSNQLADDKASDNPFAGGKSADNPFAGGQASANPFANDKSSDNPFAGGSSSGSPFASSGSKPATTASGFSSDMAKRKSLKKRMAEAEQLVMISVDGFLKSKVPLEFGKLVGREGLVGRVFYTEAPMPGLLFWRDDDTYLTPSNPGESDVSISAAGAGQAVYGFNLNFKAGKLRGVQTIFGNLDSGTIAANELTNSAWVGQAPTVDKPKSVNGSGKPVHGFLFYKNGKDIVGFKPVVPK